MFGTVVGACLNACVRVKDKHRCTIVIDLDQVLSQRLSFNQYNGCKDAHEFYSPCVELVTCMCSHLKNESDLKTF